MKTLKLALLWLFGFLVLIQFIHIDIPPAPKAKPQDEIVAPKEISKLLKRSCYDCHSNHTNYPWYGYIEPIGWEVNSHIKNGRNWLNFSIWNSYSKKRQKKLYEGIAQAIESKMPIGNYLWIHKDARLTKEQREAIKRWAEKMASSIQK